MATIVALIVTGDLERDALPQSLGKHFPGTSFTAQKVDSFTSAAVTWPPAASPGVLTNIEKYVRAFIAALHPGKHDPKPDYVFGLDDLELVNRHQPAEVIRVVREAVAGELARRRGQMNLREYEKLEAAVKDRCSFHLLVPMCEAYFFASDAALRAAGCTRQAILVPGRDVEAMESADAAYVAAPEKSATWAIDPARRPFHAKRYLEFLLSPVRYRETDHGAKALAALDWEAVLAQQQGPCFLRSLFQDLEEALGGDINRFPGQAHPLTAAWGDQNRILRNC